MVRADVFRQVLWQFLSVRLRRVSDFSRGAFLAAAGGEMRSNYLKYSALIKSSPKLLSIAALGRRRRLWLNIHLQSKSSGEQYPNAPKENLSRIDIKTSHRYRIR